MGLRHVAAATVLVLAGATLVAAPAAARPEVERRDGDHYPVSVTSEVPAGGSTTITTPTVPRGAASVKVTVAPRDPTAEEGDVFDRFVHSVGTLAKSKRLLVCLMVYQAVVTPEDLYTSEAEVDAYHVTLAGAVLLACLQMAGLLTSSTAGDVPARARATSRCGQARPSLPTSAEQVEGGWSLTGSGTAAKARRPKLKVGCRVKGDKVVYRVRAAAKGVPVRRVVGKRLMVGMRSPADATTSVPVKVTLDVP